VFPILHNSYKKDYGFYTKKKDPHVHVRYRAFIAWLCFL
jgi:hypothetical protein